MISCGIQQIIGGPFTEFNVQYTLITLINILLLLNFKLLNLLKFLGKFYVIDY